MDARLLLAILYGVVVVFLATVTAGMAASAGKRPTGAARRWRSRVLPVQIAAIVLVDDGFLSRKDGRYWRSGGTVDLG